MAAGRSAQAQRLRPLVVKQLWAQAEVVRRSAEAAQQKSLPVVRRLPVGAVVQLKSFPLVQQGRVEEAAPRKRALAAERFSGQKERRTARNERRKQQCQDSGFHKSDRT